MKMIDDFFENFKYNKKMMRKYFPDDVKASVLMISPDDVKNKKALILDVDNTLCRHDENEIPKEKKEWIHQMKKQGINVFLISNNHAPRIEKMAKSVACDCYGFALKPMKHVYKKILKKYDLTSDEVLCIGDQLLTDIVGAKRMKMKAIYVKPISESDIIYTKFSRKIENWILKEIL